MTVALLAGPIRAALPFSLKLPLVFGTLAMLSLAAALLQASLLLDIRADAQLWRKSKVAAAAAASTTGSARFSRY